MKRTSYEDARYEVFTFDEVSSRDLLGCDAVQRCGRIPTFRRTVL